MKNMSPVLADIGPAAAQPPSQSGVTQSECVARLEVSRWHGQHWTREQDHLAVELPVALEFNGISHAVMLATPCDLENFALGFALSEGIVENRGEFYHAEAETGPHGITLHCEISSQAFQKLKARRRTLAGRTGCGLCGTESLDQVLRNLPAVPGGAPLDITAMHAALESLAGRQPLTRLTGAMHAAAWSMPQGKLLEAYEDVGRHNALDKLIGAMAGRGEGFGNGFLLITSRASVEMVQKAGTVGISCLVAISAPTALAVKSAQDAGMTLIAFARGDDFVAYAHGERVRNA